MKVIMDKNERRSCFDIKGYYYNDNTTHTLYHTNHECIREFSTNRGFDKIVLSLKVFYTWEIDSVIVMLRNASLGLGSSVGLLSNNLGISTNEEGDWVSITTDGSIEELSMGDVCDGIGVNMTIENLSELGYLIDSLVLLKVCVQKISDETERQLKHYRVRTNIEGLLDMGDEEIKKLYGRWDNGDCSSVGLVEILLHQLIKEHKEENGEYYDTDYDNIVLRYP